MGLTLPARIAIAIAVGLAVVVITAFVFAVFSRDSAHPYEFLRRFVIPAILVAVIPFFVYHTLRLWLEGEASPFPDIEDAWHQGLAAIVEHGLDIRDIPLILILGARDAAHADSLMQASGFEFIVPATPTGRHPLRWYANDEAVFIVFTGLGCLSKLNGMAAGSASSGGASSINQTLVAGGIQGTLAPGGLQDSGPSPAPDSPPPGGSIKSTLVAGEFVAPSPSQDQPAPARGGSMQMTRQIQEEEAEKLQFVCQLMNRSRQPFCPFNGIMTLLPINTVHNIMYSREMADCVSRDLKIVRESTRLSSTVTALVTDMETELGFMELVRRVGVQRAKETRFGKGFQPWNNPSAENLDALSSHACGAFEDWVYMLFREKDGLTKAGNVKLYALLCRIRSDVQNRLRSVIASGYNNDESEEKAEMFAGCYFAATGNSPDQQAFVRNTLERVIQLAGDLKWIKGAEEEDGRFHSMSMYANAASVLLLVISIVILVVTWNGS